jgi:carbamoyl-phosphate synthase large subunit
VPKRRDLRTILVIGAGPIVIGQACEFDYSGTQAVRALREEGYRVALVNSNPATIMTDPATADVVYVEPLEHDTLVRILEVERPEALLPTMGGQTALNLALELDTSGALRRFGVELIGARRAAIEIAEDREKFRAAMAEIGLKTPPSRAVRCLEDALAVQAEIGFPTVIRPSFTLGGTGGGIAYNREEFVEIAERGLSLSPTQEILVERSLLGWKEFELEVVRDSRDNVIVVCGIENLDPMGIHTGDSVTVAPIQTLTDKEYQAMRDAAAAVVRRVGVDTGGANVQFAVDPRTGRLNVIEMNPRVSRSSALASKATGFPIARVAAKLAVGYTLDELRNEITDGRTPASFEPTLDYVVVKVPRFTFEKFPETQPQLGTQMQSVGEVMAVGGSFQEALQKALRGLETGVDGLVSPLAGDLPLEERKARVRDALAVFGPERLAWVAEAFRLGFALEEVHAATAIDPWFLGEIADLVAEEEALRARAGGALEREELARLKRKGFADSRLGTLLGLNEDEVRARRHALGLRPVYKRIDSCAAEFPTSTAYLYSTYAEEDESAPDARRKVIVLGGGPNRIGQGLEFDYCCVHAAMALREDGFETVMINCNPETVSTDFDTQDRLYFEPLTFEDVSEVVARERPEAVIVQYGGQTPLKLASRLAAAGVPIPGTSAEAIDRAEDRARFQALVQALGLRQTESRSAHTVADALASADALGFPLLARPSYVLGGRAMEVLFDREELEAYMTRLLATPQVLPVLLDRYLTHAVEIDVDIVADGREVLIGGIMEHVEHAGVHSGDSICSLPAHSLDEVTLGIVREQSVALARALGVVGLMNVQFAVQDGAVYLLEANPRASRTVPFVSKAIGLPLAKIGARAMMGRTFDAQGVLARERRPRYVSVKAPVFPFLKLRGSDPILGPEMKSTGEVMGIGESFGEAYAKAQLAVGTRLPRAGRVLLSVRDRDKPAALVLARELVARGFRLVATRGTAAYLEMHGVACPAVLKVREGRPHVVDLIINGEVDLIVNTTEGRQAIAESRAIRREAIQRKVTYYTTIAAALATLHALDFQGGLAVRPLNRVLQEVRIP